MDLATWCDNLVSATASADAWVKRNPDLVRNEKEGILKDLRRAARLFRSCARAASRKMSVGVFGPSQAGKSYLISALARGTNNELGAIFGDSQHDFLSEINPEGGKEATGLVTRFTLTKDPAAPPNCPVRLSMLSETDLVKIIANTYYADCEHKDVPEVRPETLDRLREMATNGQTHIDLDALEDLREYIVNDFKAKPRVQELERGFWDIAFELGPRLDLEGRILLYSIIWDEVEEFTDLLRRLLKPLEALEHPEICYSSLDALIPRERSIIDVATLGELDQDKPELELVTPAGKRIRLPRALVTALTAELTITMAEKPAPYFEHTDLLDFPGYRSRYKLDDIRRELKKEGMLKELFLRGKVAYLFQRYSAQRELNGMLLCIGPSNQEVQDLPAVINAWIASTHGETPELREGRQISLFLVLTKFDMEFEVKKGAPSVEARWDNRLHASLLDFFGKQHDWPAKWTPGQAFNNIFMLRNPNFQFKAVMQFNGDQETGISPGSLQLVDDLKRAFMDSPLVARHFKDKTRAWNEAMRLNDGGITYIRESLEPVCDPQIKRQQLLDNINACRQNIIDRLEGFYQSDDKGELTRKKLQLIVSLFQSLGDMEKQRHRMGRLLRDFTISDAEIYNMHNEAMRRHREAAQAATKELPQTQEAEIDLDSLDLGKLNPFENESDEEQPAATVETDEASAFASYIESKWVEHLHALAADPAKQKFFMLPEKLFSSLAGELATGMERMGLREKMAQEFRNAAAYANTDKYKIARRQSALAARIINEYIDWLGFNPHAQTDQQRTIKLPGNRNAIVFQPPEAFSSLPRLGEKQARYTQKWLGDWLNAMAGLIIDNVSFDGEKTINLQENMALGEILAKFSAQPA